ncbi:hypothetical protein SDC9_179230 [bioreactor metagenome]|uniref:Uncharacterized protein n=1 Tax=bioreactor metagenome TaxID=1076179 RepID=A0A645GY61_9ZZZZ
MAMTSHIHLGCRLIGNFFQAVFQHLVCFGKRLTHHNLIKIKIHRMQRFIQRFKNLCMDISILDQTERIINEIEINQVILTNFVHGNDSGFFHSINFTFGARHCFIAKATGIDRCFHFNM